MHYLTEQNFLIFLIQVFLLLGLARGLGELFRKWKQPAFTAEILVGIMLGPTVFGRFFPQLHQLIFPPDIIQQNMLEVVAWLGFLFFLLNTGLEVDFSSAWRQRGDALKIAITDIVVPITISFVLCLFLPARYLVNSDQRLLFSLFMATAMTISAMPIAARALYDLKLSKTDLGFLIVSALSVNDIIGWIVFTVVLSLFTHRAVNVVDISVVLMSALGFTFLCLTAGRNFVNSAISKMKVLQMPQPATSLTFVCLLGLLCGAITQKIGMPALLGFFIAGVMIGEAKDFSERSRQVVSQMVYAIFVPLFFAGIGLRLDIFENFELFLVLFVTVVSIAGKFLGAWLGVNFTNLSKANRLSVAICHIPGGSMEIVVGLLAFEYHLISAPVFIAIIFGAATSSVIFGPCLSYSIKRRKTISILEFFSRQAVVTGIKVSDRDEVIKKLCEIAAELEEIQDVEAIYTPVLQRESIVGTALEEGVAVPHARLNFIKRPVVIFGRSLAGIEWNSPDGKLTQFIFLVLTPQDDDEAQLQILSLIAMAMSKEQTRNEIISAKDIDGVWVVLQKSLMSSQITRK